MKKIFLALCMLWCVNIFAQDWDDEYTDKEHRQNDEYVKDYFTVGLYTGSYVGVGELTEANFYFNSIASEIEYVKFSDLSVYVRGIYQFSNLRQNTYSNSEEPFHYKMIISFGGRYYIRKKGGVKPYLQLGINQETQYQKNWGYNFYYFMNIGLGFNIKISKRLSFDMKYDLNKTLDKKTYYSFNGFSVLAGLKYNL